MTASIRIKAAFTRSAWPLTKADVDKGIEQIQAHGMDGLVYGEALHTWEERLFSLARAALGSDEQAYLAPLEDSAAHKFWWNVN